MESGRKSQWQFNYAYGMGTLVVAAFVPNVFMGKVAQFMLVLVGSVSLYRGGVLHQYRGRGLDVQVGRWMLGFVGSVAVFLLAMMIWSDERAAKVVLAVVGGLHTFMAGMVRERSRVQV